MFAWASISWVIEPLAVGSGNREKPWPRMHRAEASMASICWWVWAGAWASLSCPGNRWPHEVNAAVNVGVVVKECLNAAGAATGLGKPSTPCERKHVANRSMSRFAWATVIRWPLSLVIPDGREPVGWCDPDPHA